MLLHKFDSFKSNFNIFLTVELKTNISNGISMCAFFKLILLTQKKILDNWGFSYETSKIKLNIMNWHKLYFLCLRCVNFKPKHLISPLWSKRSLFSLVIFSMLINTEISIVFFFSFIIFKILILIKNALQWHCTHEKLSSILMVYMIEIFIIKQFLLFIIWNWQNSCLKLLL